MEDAPERVSEEAPLAAEDPPASAALEEEAGEAEPEEENGAEDRPEAASGGVPAPPPSARRSLSQRLPRRWLVIAGVLLALALAQAAMRAARTRGWSGERRASWIWAAGEPDRHAPEAFFAVRDFELDFVPQQARLEVVADEEYWLYVNGQSIGANRYLDGAPMDVFLVGGYLRPGTNRLLLELRSSRGVGGALVRFEATGPGGQSLRLVSDGSWKILRSADQRLTSGEPLIAWEEPEVWGPPGEGRWGIPVPGEPRLTLARLKRRKPPLEAPLYSKGETHRWRPVARDRANPRPLGDWVTFDFGGVHTGYLSLAFASDEIADGLLWITQRPVDPRQTRPTACVVAPAGRTFWTDALPRRFRYVTLLGSGSVAAAELHRVHPDRVGGLLRRNPRPRGVLGLQPPHLMTAVEDEVWGQLEGVTRFGGREGG